jgi:ABC-type transporter Mla maintaining outer membrane lipid asymmetry ATPase subunit MlaF
MSTPVLEITGIRKEFGGLRPLRLASLRVAEGESVALAGFDATTAEVLVNLVTGATLPDEGRVRVFGRSTDSIVDSDEWLTFADRFGILTARAVLLDGLSIEANLAVPLTLDIDPVPDAVRPDVIALAAEVGIEESALAGMAGSAPAGTRQRIRLARAIALRPAMLLLEHPTAGLAPGEVAAFAEELGRVAANRRMATLTLMARADAARAFAPRVLTLNPATGALVASDGLMGTFRWLLRR